MMKKKDLSKKLKIACLAILIAGLVFTLIIVIKGINDSFEITHDEAKQTAEISMRF